MAKKTKSTAPEKVIEKVINQNITDTLELNYMPYAMSVIISRAIPEIDGFKPAHRKLLYTMYKMGLLTGHKMKSADVVGQTMRLNPHGDIPIYETLVRLTRGNETLLHPFIDSKGNFGKQYSRDMAYAASRYTEVKLDAICQEIFRDIDNNAVDYVNNYSATMLEPVLLPTTFPNIIVNPNQGIAVGMASNICSFNLKEVCTATINYINNENTDISKYIKAPDFNTGGQIIYNKAKLDEIYETGRGSFKLRAKYEVDEKNSLILIKEIPYTTNIEAIVDKIVSLIKNGKIKEVSDLRDETDLNGLSIAIEYKKGTNVQHLMHKLFTMTTLEDTFSANFNILIDGKPKTLGIKGILYHWIQFRVGCVKRVTSHDISKKSDKLHVLEGLSKILLDIDKAIRIIRNTEQEEQVIPNLMSGFGIDNTQAEFIAEIKLRNLNKEYILKRTNEISELINQIAYLKNLLEDETQIKQIIAAQLKEVSKKYGKDRLTDIIYKDDVPLIEEHELIQDYDTRLILTKHGYFKKIPASSLRLFNEQKLKDDDSIQQEITTTNKSDIIMFSDRQNAYKLRTYEAADMKASSYGEYLPNLLGLEPDEKIIYMHSTKNYAGFILFGYDNGRFAKVLLESYSTKTNRKKLMNAYSAKAKLIYISAFEEEADIVILRDQDKAALFNTSLLQPLSSKNSVGVQVYKLKKNSAITRVCLSNEIDLGSDEHYRTLKIPTTGHFIVGNH